MTPIWHPSPNFGPRKGGAGVELVVIHYTAMRSATAALNVLCDPENEVSAHYLIGRDGTVYQMVEEADRAWHAGAGCWGAVTDINSCSIGVELDNDGFSPFSAPMMDSLEGLLRDILLRHKLRPFCVLGHSDLAPGRKIDPGLRFDWARLARGGLAAAVRPETVDAPFRALAQAVGYTAEVDDAVLLDAVRRRVRPWGKGALVEADLAALGGLARSLGVDPQSGLA